MAAALLIAWQAGLAPAFAATDTQPGEKLALVAQAAREALPPLPFKRLDGNAASVADFSGRIVVLNLWATWCAPCKKEMPSLSRLQAAYPKDKVQVVALSVDRGADAKVRQFVDEEHLDGLDIYRDATMATPRTLELPGLPATLLIDREGKVAARVLGDREWDGAEARSVIDALLAEPAPQ